MKNENPSRDVRHGGERILDDKHHGKRSGMHFGEMGDKQALLATTRTQGEIPDPTFGYLRRSSIEYRMVGNAFRNGLIERDLGNLVYVDKLGRIESEVSSMRETRGCACRHHTRYTRGRERRGDQWRPLEALFVDRVAIQEDISGNQLTKSEITEDERRGTQQEQSLANRGWGSGRRQNALKREAAFVDVARMGNHSGI